MISTKPNQHPKQRLVSFPDFQFMYAASAGPLVADLSSSYRLSEHRATAKLQFPPFHVATGNSKERKGAFSPRFMFQKKTEHVIHINSHDSFIKTSQGLAVTKKRANLHLFVA